MFVNAAASDTFQVEDAYSVLPHLALHPLKCQMVVNISNQIKGTAHLTSSSTLVTSAWDPRSTFRVEGGFARE
jgi:hypothetical protein